MRAFIAALALWCALAALAPHAAGQQIDVFVSSNPPFVANSFDADGNLVLVGFEVDLWAELFSSLQREDASRTFAYHLVPFTALFNATVSTPNAIAMASITMTAARERRYGTFSVPYFNSGLDVLVRTTDSRTNLFLFFAPFSTQLWISIIVTLYFSGHVIWFLERNYQPVHFPRAYLRGVNEGVWYCWGILTGTCSKDLIGFPSRMYSIGWSILSVVVVAAYTANLATILTVQQLDANVSSYQQLGGKRVGAVAGATGESFTLANLPNAALTVFPIVEDAFAALKQGTIDAIVHDAPSLIHLKTALDTEDVFQLLGEGLTKENYAFLLPHGFNAALARQMDQILLQMTDNGMVDALYRKWFNYATAVESATVISSDPQALSLRAVSGMYITLAVSLVASLVTFVVLRVRRWF